MAAHCSLRSHAKCRFLGVLAALVFRSKAQTSTEKAPIKQVVTGFFGETTRTSLNPVENSLRMWYDLSREGDDSQPFQHIHHTLTRLDRNNHTHMRYDLGLEASSCKLFWEKASEFYWTSNTNP